MFDQAWSIVLVIIRIKKKVKIKFDVMDGEEKNKIKRTWTHKLFLLKMLLAFIRITRK